MKYSTLLDFVKDNALTDIKLKIPIADINYWLPDLNHLGLKSNTIVRYTNGDICIGTNTVTGIKDIRMLCDLDTIVLIADNIGFLNLNRQ